MTGDGSMLEEQVLRRALRLDADEMPARIDPALIAAAAREAPVGARTLAVAMGVAFAGGWVWSEALRAILGAAADATGIDPVAVAVGAVDLVAIRLVPFAEGATSPVIPIAIFVAAALAVLFENRGRTHVTAP